MKKKTYKLLSLANFACWCMFFGIVAFSFSACTENISDEAYAVADDVTMTQYIQENPDLSDIRQIFERVKLGSTSNASTLSSVLSARGNYTVFAPNNEAVRHYVDSVTNHESTDFNALSEEQIEHIALNCIIDNGSASAYELADFDASGAAFGTSTLGNRRLSSMQDEAQDYYIDGTSKVVQSNIEVSNGVLHIVDRVIYPSTATVADLIKAADNMRIMGKLLELTAWDDSLGLNTEEEEAYINANINNAGTTRTMPGTAVTDPFDYQDRRAIKYTAFVETDEVFQTDWGVSRPIYDEATGEITNWAEIEEQIVKKCRQLMQLENESSDYKDMNNSLNQFVAYHLLDGGMPLENSIHHFNEYRYSFGADGQNPQTTTLTVDVWDYYVTKGYPRGLLKITQVANKGLGPYDFYLNRVTKYDDGINGNYDEVSTRLNEAGANGINIKVNSTNGSNTNFAVNGYYYPIEHILINNPGPTGTQEILGSERIRFDITTILPEFASNDIRGKLKPYFPLDFFRDLVPNNEQTEFWYLQNQVVGSKGAWKDYQGDEILVTGRYDFTLKLPPVPSSGTYEIRMGVSNNNVRGMVQVYLAEDRPSNTTPLGLPIDMRETASMIPGTPWVDDAGLSDEQIRENDRNLRNQGYMKGPKYICKTTMPTTSIRNADGNNAGDGPALRRILTTHYMERGKNYYLCFKNAMESSSTQLYIDYFEFVPTTVVNSPTPEDIW